MLVRNIEIVDCSHEAVWASIKKVFASRECYLSATQESDVFQFDGLQGCSALVSGKGLVAIVTEGQNHHVRIGLEFPMTTTGVFLGVISLLLTVLSLPTLGFTLLLFWLTRDYACHSVTRELDRIADEIEALRPA